MTMEPRKVLYCGACGMPPEYCEYGPDYETHCNPWLLKHDPNMHAELRLKSKRPSSSNAKASAASNESTEDGDTTADALPTRPWTTEERLRAFYEKYVPEKLDGIPALLEKYQGKEDKLFMALAKKYGPEPEDPYVAQFDSDSDDDDDEESVEGKMGGLKVSDKNKRRGAGAKRVNKVHTRVVIQKISRNKRKAVTMVVGMDTVPDIKLKDVAKAFSKRFAGSSSVKDMAGGGKEIIIQGDHTEEVATMIIEKFKVSPDCVFLDIDGEFVPMT